MPLSSAPAFQRPEHPRSQPRDVCPHCKSAVSIYEFAAPDGVPIKSAWCPEHGDVVPMLSAVVNEVYLDE